MTFIGRTIVSFVLISIVAGCVGKGEKLLEQSRQSYGARQYDKALNEVVSARAYLKDLAEAEYLEKKIRHDYTWDILNKLDIGGIPEQLESISAVHRKVVEVAGLDPDLIEAVDLIAAELAKKTCTVAREKLSSNEAGEALRLALLGIEFQKMEESCLELKRHAASEICKKSISEIKNALDPDRIIGKYRMAYAAHLSNPDCEAVKREFCDQAASRVTILLCENGYALAKASNTLNSLCRLSENEQSKSCQMRAAILRYKREQEVQEKVRGAVSLARKELAFLHTEVLDSITKNKFQVALQKITSYRAKLDSERIRGLGDLCEKAILESKNREKAKEIRTKVDKLRKVFFATVKDSGGAETDFSDFRLGHNFIVGETEVASGLEQILAISYGKTVRDVNNAFRYCKVEFVGGTSKSGRCKTAGFEATTRYEWNAKGKTNVGSVSTDIKDITSIRLHHNGHPLYCPTDNILYYSNRIKLCPDGTPLIPLQDVSRESIERATTEERSIIEAQSEIIASLQTAAQGGDEEFRRQKAKMTKRYGESMVLTVVRTMPIYDFDGKRIVTLDTYVKDMSGKTTDGHPMTNLENDPLGTVYRLMFGPPDAYKELIEDMRKM